MLDSTVTLKNISSFLNGLSEVLKAYDNSFSIIRFGSSLTGLPLNDLDIDLLLISKKSYFENNIYSIISELKSSIISGHNVHGTPTEVNHISTIFSNYIQRQTILKNSIINPRFIFGPYNEYSVNDSFSNIYLHVKGPITEKEFKFFCKELPFHGYSILENHQVISGSFYRQYFSRNIKLTKDSLHEYNLGLHNRVEVSDSLLEVRKCIKKLFQNYEVYFKYYKIKPMLTLMENDTNNITILKNSFLDLYNQVFLELSELSNKKYV